MSTDDDEDRRETLRALMELARGKRKDGRDQLAGSLTMVPGGFSGTRTLPLELVEVAQGESARRLVVRTGPPEAEAEIAIELVPTGEYIFTHGDLRVRAADRRRGAAFVDAAARWLGRPLVDRGGADVREPEPLIRGSYVKLGEKRDTDGVDWDMYKLSLAHAGVSAELFFRVALAAARAALAEKGSMFRDRLIALLEAALGRGRTPAERKPIRLGDGELSLTVPVDWTVVDKQGHIESTDPTDEASVQVSFMLLPPLRPGAPDLLARLHLSLEPAGHADAVLKEQRFDRGDLELAWVEYAFDSDDPRRGGKRPARGRWLLASDERIQGLVTYYYWVDDERWAVPEWERIIDSIELAGGQELVPDVAGYAKPTRRR